jgi:sigma-E factor negative regulatory protein RseB
LKSLLLALLLALSAPSLHAACDAGDEEALKWLDRMSRSLREVSYHGVFTYQHGNTLQTMRISHSVAGGKETEQVTRLTGSGASVLRTEHPLDCIHPGHKLLRIGSDFTRSDDECGLASHYRLKMDGELRVAGRDAVTVRILPRDMYRYGYQMALDTRTGLLLRSQTVAQDGKVLERFQFADLRIGEVDSPGTRVDLVHHARHPEATAQPAADVVRVAPDAWRAGWVPEGFLLTAGSADSTSGKTYTDGLAVFSVFLEPAEQALAPGEGRARMGGTTAYTRGLQLAGRPVLITIVGEVPVNAARMVADSVQWVSSDAD